MATAASAAAASWRVLLVVLWVCVEPSLASEWKQQRQQWTIDLPPTDFGSLDLSSSAAAQQHQRPTMPMTTRKPTHHNPENNEVTLDRFLFQGKQEAFNGRRRKIYKGGRIDIDLRGTSVSLFQATEVDQDTTTITPDLTTADKQAVVTSAQASSFHNSKPMNTNTESQHQEITLSMDPLSSVRLIRSMSAFSASMGSAFMGTLRLLAPLILARRALNAAGDLVLDYLRGRYLRTTYTRLENMYIRYYELPAALRALSRTLAQVGILFLLGRIQRWMVGMHHAPCRLEDGRCRMWCVLLWMVAVLGCGHACSTAVAVWGGPLRVQVAASHLHTGRNLAARVFTRPWHILQWMQDPEQWISMMSTPQNYIPQPFDPNPILFPATWVPLKLLLMMAVTRAASSTPSNWHSSRDPVRAILRRFLIHHALADEWHRVFINEKRVGLAIGVVFCYMIASLSLTLTTAFMDPLAAVMMLPSLLALCVSGWMNIVIFWNRLADDRKRDAINAFHERRQAALKALKGDGGSTRPAYY